MSLQTSQYPLRIIALGDMMSQLNKKYVFHIPLFKYQDNNLQPIEIDDLLDDLINQLTDNGFENLYMTKVKGFYKSRCFDELLITLFTPDDQTPQITFEKWFRNNNGILEQEEFAYECNNKLIIEKLFK